jgi:hypothetical protein
MKNPYKIVVEKSEGKKRSLDRPGYRCENNIKIYLKEIGIADVD